jgi:uncharacterized protein YegL
MDAIKNEAIGHFNEHLQQIKDSAKNQEVKVGVVTFNNPQADKVLYWDTDIATIEEITKDNYIPNGVTALHDAIGVHVGEIKRQVEAKLVSDDPNRTNRAGMVVIITDGYENASMEYKPYQVRQLMKSLEDHPKWTVVYLGANQNIFEVADSLGIKVNSSRPYEPTKAGLAAASVVTRNSYAGYFDSRLKGNTSKNFWGQNPEEDPQ